MKSIALINFPFPPHPHTSAGLPLSVFWPPHGNQVQQVHSTSRPSAWLRVSVCAPKTAHDFSSSPVFSSFVSVSTRRVSFCHPSSVGKPTSSLERKTIRGLPLSCSLSNSSCHVLLATPLSN